MVSTKSGSNNTEDSCEKCALASTDFVRTEVKFIACASLEYATATNDNIKCQYIKTEQKPLKYSNNFAVKVLNTNKTKGIWRIPWFILCNCFLQICLYVFANERLSQELMFIPALSSQYWRFITYTLLHADLMHLWLNISLQILIGFTLEYEQGHWKVVLIYIAGGCSGSLATFFFQPQLSLLGASAGVYSLLISHIPHLVKNFTQLPFSYFRIVALVVLCLSDAAFTAFHVLVNHNENPRICLDAHIAGGMTGFLLGFLIYAKRANSNWTTKTSKKEVHFI